MKATVRLVPIWKQGRVDGAYLPIPDFMVAQLGWHEGDDIEITIREQDRRRDSWAQIELRKVG